MNKTIFITGGSRGIGKAIALKFAKNQFNIVLNYVSNETAALNTQKEIEALGSKVLLLKGDVSDLENVKQMVKKSIDTFSKIDVLVNNAGIKKDGPIENMKETDFDAVMNINVKGVFAMIQSVLTFNPKDTPMRIINISSETGLMGKVNQVNYAASKFAVNGLTMSLAKELGPKNITVNAIAPSLTNTDMTDYVSEEKRKTLTQNNPLKRLGTPEDIASACYFLTSEDASFINGQIIAVNGGTLSP